MRASWARTVVKVAVLLAVGILLQTTFGNDLRVDDFAPDFMMLLAVGAGFVGGPDTGAVVGFAAGGMAALDSIERAGNNVLSTQCRPGKLRFAGRAASGLLAASLKRGRS